MINNRSSAILGIGKVNLSKWTNAMFGNIWECWGESPNETSILVQNVFEPKKMIAVFTSGTPEQTAKAYLSDPSFGMTFHHDQSRRSIPGVWKVLAVVPHTPAGLLKIREIAGVNSILFYTFK